MVCMALFKVETYGGRSLPFEPIRLTDPTTIHVPVLITGMGGVGPKKVPRGIINKCTGSVWTRLHCTYTMFKPGTHDMESKTSNGYSHVSLTYTNSSSVVWTTYFPSSFPRLWARRIFFWLISIAIPSLSVIDTLQ